MLIVVIILLLLAAAAGILWEVIEVAAWIAFVLFLVGTVIVLGAYGWFRKRFGDRGTSSAPPP